MVFPGRLKKRPTRLFPGLSWAGHPKFIVFLLLLFWLSPHSTRFVDFGDYVHKQGLVLVYVVC